LFVTAGILISYGHDLDEQNRQAAGYIDRILKGQIQLIFQFSCPPNSRW
jgi:hypothetical protein